MNKDFWSEAIANPCCISTVNKLLEHLDSKEWKNLQNRMLEKHGRILSLVEMKCLAIEEGRTLKEKIEEYES